ncbi:hypothetical protein HYT95_02310 [Candidatus Peregrinibacteria bacterium]|nr:hypothetical protein [Candidatus Peregrinibacteria bacterium]
MRRLPVLLLLIVAGGFLWYRHALSPIDPGNSAERLVNISEGMSVGSIADVLEVKGIIR